MHDDEDETDFDEDWSSTDDDLADCPECGAEVYLELNDGRCPGCGYWFLESDRRMRQQGEGGLKPIYKIAVILILLAFLLPVLLLLLQ